MKTLTKEEQAIVERSKLIVQTKGKRRLIPLILGIAMIFMALKATWELTDKLENLGGKELCEGFIAGFFLSIIVVLFGFTGALCIGKFLSGFEDEYLAHELLIKLSERLEKQNG